MGLAESALILLGIGIVSSRFKAGVGLGELGTGISTLVAAPLVGTGTGLSTFSGGVRDLAETLGDLGRGFGELFKHIPKLPPPGGWLPFIPGITDENGNGAPPVNGNGIWNVVQPYLIVDSGGNDKTLLTGGGGNVPTNGPVVEFGTDIGPITGTYSQIFSFYETRGFTPTQIHSLIDPQFTRMLGTNV